MNKNNLEKELKVAAKSGDILAKKALADYYEELGDKYKAAKARTDAGLSLLKVQVFYQGKPFGRIYDSIVGARWLINYRTKKRSWPRDYIPDKLEDFKIIVYEYVKQEGFEVSAKKD